MNTKRMPAKKEHDTVFYFIALIFSVVSIWANAAAASILWGWFVVPVFEVAPITLPQAFGIALLVSFWVKPLRGIHQKDSSDEYSKGEIALGYILTSVYASIWVVVVGYIVKEFFL